MTCKEQLVADLNREYRSWPRIYVQARPGAKAVEVARIKEISVAQAALSFYLAKGLRAWVVT